MLRGGGSLVGQHEQVTKDEGGWVLVGLLFFTTLAAVAALTLLPVAIGWRFGWRWRLRMTLLSLACYLPAVIAVVGDEQAPSDRWGWFGLLSPALLFTSVGIAAWGRGLPTEQSSGRGPDRFDGVSAEHGVGSGQRVQ